MESKKKKKKKNKSSVFFSHFSTYISHFSPSFLSLFLKKFFSNFHPSFFHFSSTFPILFTFFPCLIFPIRCQKFPGEKSRGGGALCPLPVTPLMQTTCNSIPGKKRKPICAFSRNTLNILVLGNTRTCVHHVGGTSIFHYLISSMNVCTTCQIAFCHFNVHQ